MAETIRILLAEDDLVTRMLVMEILDRHGCEVTAVEDGEHAWEVLCKPDAPPLVILDWMMPGVSGLELCRRLRNKETSEVVPYVILLTSKKHSVDIIRGLDAGADDYIVKPPEPHEFMARVLVGARILGLQRKIRDQEKMRGALEMAGAVCHELNQPLQVVTTLAELLQADAPANDEQGAMLEQLQDEVLRIGTLMRKIMYLSTFKTRDYMGGKRHIVDLRDPSADTPEGA